MIASERALSSDVRVKPREIDFAALYQELAPRVFTYVYRHVGNRQDAEDITSETFTRAFSSASKPPADSVSPWIYTIAKNLMIDRARHRKRWHPALLFAPSTQSDPDDEILLRSLLDELSAEARDAILLRFLAGLSSAEIGAILGKNSGAVKMLVHRALLKLRKRWQEEVVR